MALLSSTVFPSMPAVRAVHTPAKLNGRLRDHNGPAGPGADVRLENFSTSYREETRSEGNGEFRFTNGTFRDCLLDTKKPGIESSRRTLALRTTVAQELGNVAQTGTRTAGAEK